MCVWTRLRVCVRVLAMLLIHSLPLRTELSAGKIYSLNLALQLDCCPELSVSSVSPPPLFPLTFLSLSAALSACLFVHFLSWAQHFKIHNFKAKHSSLQRVLSNCPTPCSSRYWDKHTSLHTYIHTVYYNMATLWRCHLVSIFVYLKAFFSPRFGVW